MLNYLKSYLRDDITNLLNDSNDCLHVSLSVNLTHLQRNRHELYLAIIQNVWKVIPQWNKALLEAQKELVEGNCFLEDGYQVKENCHVRFINLPKSDGPLKGSFPGNDHVGQFVQVKGNVVRMAQGRLLEFKREYQCTRCKGTFTIEAQYNKLYVFETPKKCPDPAGMCRGNLHPKNSHPKPEYCMDYQEIRLQELFSDKYIPASLLVTLENDLVDYCQPGDSVTVCGTIEVRWPQRAKGKRLEVLIVLRAISVFKDDEKINFGKDLSEQLIWVRAQWQDTIDTIGQLNARDMIIRSICPEIHGMYLVKLAIALALCSGVQCTLAAGANKRGSSHLLLVGDPGLAKSRLLKAASKIALRSVHTTGLGCSAAGLTAAAIKEEGEWQLEAGALVLADGGVCCIDEFNLMSENDKASIHEAMEQQTISMAKAGLVCRLSTRCVVLAATNPKNLYSMSEAEGTSCINIGIGSPLLSRFDIVLILRDERDPEWDVRICDHILKNTNNKSISDDIWELERLQSHFLAVQEINPELTDEANIILGAYYKHCRSDPMRDFSRTTARLLDSLNRLAQAHARLMFREKVNSIDALVVIRLMESSWGFGRLLNSIHVLRENLPIGPSEDQVRQVTNLLGMENLNENIMENLRMLNMSKRETTTSKMQDEPITSIIGNLQSLFGYNKENVKNLQRDVDLHEKGKLFDNRGDHTNPILEEKSNNKRSSLKSPSAKTKHVTNGNKRKETSPKTPRASKKQPEKSSSLKNPKKSTPKSVGKKIVREAVEKLSSTNANSRLSLFDANIFDDSSDMELFKSLDAIPPPTNKNCEEAGCSKTCDKEHSAPISKSPAVQTSCRKAPFFGRLGTPMEMDEDIDEADLDLDISFTSKSPSSSQKCSQLKTKNSLFENMTKKTIKRQNPQEKMQVIGSPPQLDTPKKPRLSVETLAKLNMFMNPKFVEPRTSRQEDKTDSTEGPTSIPNKTEDSAYETMTLQTPRKESMAQSSSHFLASLDDDLNCLDFDI